MSQRPEKKRIVIKIAVSDYVGKKKNSKTVVLLGASVGISAYISHLTSRIWKLIPMVEM